MAGIPLSCYLHNCQQGDQVNGNKENSRIVKTYVCKCGEVNRFTFETDFNFMEIRIDAHCQGCGKEISISVERHVENNTANGNIYRNYNNYKEDYIEKEYDKRYSQQYLSQSYSHQPSILELQSQSSSQYEQPSASGANPNIIDFNFEALTSAVESMSASQAPRPGTTSTIENTNAGMSFIDSLSSEIMQDGAESVEAVTASPTPATIPYSPAKRIVENAKDEEEDLLSKEDEYYGEEATSEEKEAFIDLFGRL
ncbi:MAG: hypothetical protein QW112_00525 [Candidatus Micrarchaeia archaeon]